VDPERESYDELGRKPIRLPPGWVLELLAVVLLLAVGVGTAVFFGWLDHAR
jgi:hypothetical protein